MQGKQKQAQSVPSGPTVAARAQLARNRFDRQELELEPIEAALKGATGFLVLTRKNKNGRTLYQCARVDWKDGQSEITPLRDPIPHRALAYVYLYEDVQDHYHSLTIAEAQP